MLQPARVLVISSMFVSVLFSLQIVTTAISPTSCSGYVRSFPLFRAKTRESRYVVWLRQASVPRNRARDVAAENRVLPGVWLTLFQQAQPAPACPGNSR